jgi:hypothetical protein
VSERDFASDLLPSLLLPFSLSEESDAEDAAFSSDLEKVFLMPGFLPAVTAGDFWFCCGESNSFEVSESTEDKTLSVGESCKLFRDEAFISALTGLPSESRIGE